MAATSSPGRTSLSRKPLAPARSAPKAFYVQVERCQHQHLGQRAGGRNPLGRLDAVRARHPDVHQRDVRLVPPGELDGFLAVARLAHHRQIGLGFEDHPEAAAQ